MYLMYLYVYDSVKIVMLYSNKLFSAHAWISRSLKTSRIDTSVSGAMIYKRV